eukprot:TRINITY_DN11545_c0_g1_i1.p1 TRINITY_DN11545_c0_g1~~TRINITY_DN11545_c0_g1_i1.p1  ORF type:complete len:768 (+),score=63.47 TRINITY_DN11545_c0_g1_i1:298-2601(+)
MEGDFLIESPDDVQSLVLSGLPINCIFRVGITSKTWSFLAMRHVKTLDFGSPAGRFILDNFPSDDNEDVTTTTISLGRLNRAREFKIGWKVLTEDTGVLERVLTRQGAFLRNLSFANTGESRIRSAPELNRIIKSCCSSGVLTSLTLDEINLAKCLDSFKLITYHCTSLKSLSLVGANLPPKSSDNLNSLRSLEGLFWDFGNAAVAKKIKSVPYDLAVIRKLTRLERLGLDGASGFESYFPDAVKYVASLPTDPEAIHRLIEVIHEALPPLVGIGGLAFQKGGTVFGSLVAAGLPIPILQVCIDRGARVDSFEVCPGVSTVSPLVSSLLFAPYSLPRVPGVYNHHRGHEEVQPLMFSIFKFLIENGAELENLIGGGARSWDHYNRRTAPAFTVSTIFAVAAQYRLQEDVTAFIFGELLENTAKRLQCSYRTLLVDPKLGKDVIDIALDSSRPEQVIRMIQLGVLDKLGYDINYIDPVKHQTLIVRFWTVVFKYGCDPNLIDNLIGLGADPFRPCLNYPNGVASFPPHFTTIGFIMKYAMSERKPAWPFMKDDFSLAGYLEYNACHPDSYKYVLDHLLERGQLPRLLQSFASLDMAFRRNVFTRWALSTQERTSTVLLSTIKEYTRSGVPFPPTSLAHSIAIVGAAWTAEPTLSYLRAILPVVDRNYSKDAHEALLEEAKTMAHLVNFYVVDEPDSDRRLKNIIEVDRLFTLVAFLYDLSSFKTNPACEQMNILPRFWAKLSGVDLDPEQTLLEELLQENIPVPEETE